MTDEEKREKRRLAARKRRSTPHGRVTYREYQRKLMARLRAGKKEQPRIEEKFPPIVNRRDPLLDMAPAPDPWKPPGRKSPMVEELLKRVPAQETGPFAKWHQQQRASQEGEQIYAEALEKSRVPSPKAKIIKPDRPL
jgi:hypothetical protein